MELVGQKCDDMYDDIAANNRKLAIVRHVGYTRSKRSRVVQLNDRDVDRAQIAMRCWYARRNTADISPSTTEPSHLLQEEACASIPEKIIEAAVRLLETAKSTGSGGIPT